jgi:DNA-binding HxlR family transcriptional regulator
MPRTKAPLPGRPSRNTRSGRPIVAALDLLGRRWALRILWELRDGPLVFRALQEQSGGLSPSVLNARLSELREAQIVEQRAEGYALTSHGRALQEALRPLSDWADKWARAVK